jgi:hypothetical protein
MTYVPLTPLSERTYIAIAADGRLWNTNKNELLSENHITMAG